METHHRRGRSRTPKARPRAEVGLVAEGGGAAPPPRVEVVDRFRYEPSDRNISLGFRLAGTIP